MKNTDFSLKKNYDSSFVLKMIMNTSALKTHTHCIRTFCAWILTFKLQFYQKHVLKHLSMSPIYCDDWDVYLKYHICVKISELLKLFSVLKTTCLFYFQNLQARVGLRTQRSSAVSCLFFVVFYSLLRALLSGAVIFTHEPHRWDNGIRRKKHRTLPNIYTACKVRSTFSSAL